jgi:hypothetical protein
MMNNSALASLKDIHLPTSEAWWHLAWGWWLLFFLFALLGMVLWASWSYLRTWRDKRRAYQALKKDVQSELIAMRTSYAENHDGLVLLGAISTFLRRVSITVFDREESAGLIEDEWLFFLDKQWGDEGVQEGFSDEVNANLLKYGAYQKEVDDKMKLNIEKMLDLSEKWAIKVLKNNV